MSMDQAGENKPKLLVFTTLFPNPGQPNSGLFIRERMFRVGHELPLVVIAPVPWFPFQSLIRRFRPYFRPAAPRREAQDGFDIYHPRFFSVPGLFKSLDGLFMALGALALLLRLKQDFKFDLIDSHFAYPDGYAAGLLGKWLNKPVTITLRGTEVPLAKTWIRRQLMIKALDRAKRVFSVSDSLKKHMVAHGANANKIQVVGNGVDAVKFYPIAKSNARKQLELSSDDKVLISVGGLVERKGFHRVIELLPQLRQEYPSLKYLVVGGASPEGDWSDHLRQQVQRLQVDDIVRFLGPLPTAVLNVPLSAADVFVLATSNEGWANVFLEAMACGLPVITTDVGGNKEVVCRSELGIIVPFGNRKELKIAIAKALSSEWDRHKILNYAEMNSWDSRVELLCREFSELVQGRN